MPVYPEGVAYLAAAADAGPAQPDQRRAAAGPARRACSDGIRSGLAARAGREPAPAAAWLSVELAGEGLVISVTLDDPADARRPGTR